MTNHLCGGSQGQAHQRGFEVVETLLEASGDATRLVLSFYGRDPATEQGVKRHLLVSCHPELARVCELAAPVRAPETPPACASYLRAHLGRARLAAVVLRGEVRLLALAFETREVRLEILLSLLGSLPWVGIVVVTLASLVAVGAAVSTRLGSVPAVVE